IVLDEQLEIDIPAARTVTLKTRKDADPTIAEEGGRRRYRWHTCRTTSDSDDEDEAGPKKKARKPKDPEPAAVRLTTFATWAEVGRWYGTLERPQRQPTDAIRRKALELTAGRTGDIEKMNALYDYVAGNFRYVSLSFGVGRYQPHAAADVLQHEYGDCKDKPTLLASLSESLGFHASAALINSRLKIDPDFPSPSQFDHVITRVSLGGDDLWLDTTA